MNQDDLANHGRVAPFQKSEWSPPKNHQNCMSRVVILRSLNRFRAVCDACSKRKDAKPQRREWLRCLQMWLIEQFEQQDHAAVEHRCFFCGQHALDRQEMLFRSSLSTCCLPSIEQKRSAILPGVCQQVLLLPMAPRGCLLYLRQECKACSTRLRHRCQDSKLELSQRIQSGRYLPRKRTLQPRLFWRCVALLQLRRG